MMEKIQTKKHRNVMPYYFGLMFAGLLVFSVVVMNPLSGELPVEITEEVKVIAVTQNGVVVETSLGVPVSIGGYDEVQPGDTIEVTYSVPAKYFENIDRAQRSFEALKP